MKGIKKTQAEIWSKVQKVPYTEEHTRAGK